MRHGNASLKLRSVLYYRLHTKLTQYLQYFMVQEKDRARFVAFFTIHSYELSSISSQNIISYYIRMEKLLIIEIQPVQKKKSSLNIFDELNIISVRQNFAPLCKFCKKKNCVFFVMLVFFFKIRQDCSLVKINVCKQYEWNFSLLHNLILILYYYFHYLHHTQNYFLHKSDFNYAYSPFI